MTDHAQQLQTVATPPGPPPAAAAPPRSPGRFPSRLAPGLCGVATVGVAFLAWSVACFGSPWDGVLYLKGFRLAVSPAIATVGAGQAGEEREATFRVRNLSGGPVTILGATSSCTCVSADRLPVSIPPGQGQDLRLRLKLGGKAGTLVEQGMSFLTDCPAQPSLHVSIVGRVAP